MEVHTHSHTPRKKWTHYFWEFLMLFLAVFCGFLAEYKLEQTIERHKEKEFILSMIEDLQNDTTQLSQLSSSIDRIERSIDTILMHYDKLGLQSNLELYRNIEALYAYPVFIYSDRTIQQLKSSGGMRLIKNKKAADGIMTYDAIVRGYGINDAYVDRFFENFTYQRLNIIDRQSLENDLKTQTSEEIKKNRRNYLLTTEPGILRGFKNAIYEFKIYHGGQKNDQLRLKEAAVKLINTLKKEYNLK